LRPKTENKGGGLRLSGVVGVKKVVLAVVLSLTPLNASIACFGWSSANMLENRTRVWHSVLGSQMYTCQMASKYAELFKHTTENRRQMKKSIRTWFLLLCRIHFP